MDWRLKDSQGWMLSDAAMDLMEHGRLEEATKLMREANRLRSEALEAKHAANSPSPRFWRPDA